MTQVYPSRRRFAHSFGLDRLFFSQPSLLWRLAWRYPNAVKATVRFYAMVRMGLNTMKSETGIPHSWKRYHLQDQPGPRKVIERVT